MVSVHRARRQDLDQVAKLFDEYRQFYGCRGDIDAAGRFLRARFARRESILLVGVIEGGHGPAGFAQLYPSFSSVSLAPLVVLNDLFVAPSARRLGVGVSLLHAAIAYARETGAIRVELATHTGNDAALRLYLANGFLADGEFAHLSLRLQ